MNQILAAGVRTGNGEVMIAELASGSPLPAAPEPSSLAMVGTGPVGLAGLAAMRRRSKTGSAAASGAISPRFPSYSLDGLDER